MQDQSNLHESGRLARHLDRLARSGQFTLITEKPCHFSIECHFAIVALSSTAGPTTDLPIF